MTGNEIIERAMNDRDISRLVVERRRERAARVAQQAAAGYIGPDMHGQAIHAGDFVKWGGRVWRAESEQLRWVVNGMLTAPLCTVGTSQTERLA